MNVSILNLEIDFVCVEFFTMVLHLVVANGQAPLVSIEHMCVALRMCA